MPMASTASLTQAQAARIERILAATKQLLAEKGADAITMRDISTASQVAEGTLYNRFGSKDELLIFAVLDYFETAVGARIAGYRGNRTPVEKLGYGVDVLIESLMEGRQFAHTLMGTYFRLGNAREMPDRLTDAVYRSWLPVLEEMQARRLLQPWVNLPLLCRDLCSREFATVLLWAQGKVADQGLRDQMLYTLLLPLSGLSRGTQTKEIAAVLEPLNRRLANPHPAD